MTMLRATAPDFPINAEPKSTARKSAHNNVPSHQKKMPSGKLAKSRWHIASFEDAESKLTELALHGLVGLSATPDWVRNFSKNCPTEIVIAVLEMQDQPVIALPLELIEHNGCLNARYVGSTHANANFPACDPNWLKEQSNSAEDVLHDLKIALSAAPYKIDTLILERQLASLGGFANPLVDSKSAQSPNVALSFATTRTFAEVIAERNGKKKSKKNRSQMRKFIEAGGFEFKRLSDPDEIRAVFDAFLTMKSRQFTEAGIVNVFAPKGVAKSIGETYANSTAKDAHHMVLDCLYVNGQVRAISGSSIHQKTLTVHIAGFFNDDLASTSPGEFLTFWMVEQACNSDINIFDLGVGDEPYKRSWCDIETFHCDTMMAITLKGKILAMILKLKVKITTTIKSNQTIWKIAKAIRRKL